MNEKVLVLALVLVPVLFVVASTLWWGRLSELTPKENYTLLEEKASWSLLGSGQSCKYLLQIDNPEQFKKDCSSFFSTGDENSDAYFYCDYFYDDASKFSAEYDDAQFSSNSLKMWRNEKNSLILWRCLFSENEKYCYIEWISSGE